MKKVLFSTTNGTARARLIVKTIDEEARDFQPHMYAHASYIVIDDIHKLPYKICLCLSQTNRIMI